MQSVGQQIREQRLRLGLKLEEISARTRIPLKTLQAIENDNLAGISSPFLYRSFVRQFAERLQLDYGPLVAALEVAALSMPQPRMPGESDFGKSFGKGKIAPMPVKGRSRSFRWLYSVGSLAFMLVACSSLYGVWQTSKSNWLADLSGLMPSAQPRSGRKVSAPLPSQPAVELSAKLAAPAQRSVQKPLANDAKPAPLDQSLASTTEVNAEASANRESPEFRVELSAIERTWLSIIEDGKQTFSGVLAPDQTKVLEAHDNARIRTGNAGAISCIFNGKSIGPLGAIGQVRTVVFTKSNYEVLDTPAPVALLRLPIAE